MYIDPGVGSMIIQFVIAAIAAGGATLVAFRQRIAAYFRRRKAAKNGASPIIAQADEEASPVDDLPTDEEMPIDDELPIDEEMPTEQSDAIEDDENDGEVQ